MAHPTLAVPEVSESCEFLPGLVDRVLAVYERVMATQGISQPASLVLPQPEPLNTEVK